MRAKILILTFMLVATAALPSRTQAITKTAPDKGAPGHQFVVLDTEEGRLKAGSVAIFRLGGIVVAVPLTENGLSARVARGELPLGMGGGLYAVSVRGPDGIEFGAGEFNVLAPEAPLNPTISPTSGPVLTPFTIVDPQGRMHQGDIIMFTQPFQDPKDGTIAHSVTVSADGTTAWGIVPAAVPGFNYVTVHAGDPAFNPPLFQPLEFTVTG